MAAATLNEQILVSTKAMIDGLKSVCASAGLANDSSEYKIITEAFLYKFLNDKFPNDVGTGSRTRGLFLLDYALLELTSLPAAIHDTVLVKQVEDSVMVNLLELYSESDKQVFVAVDKAESFLDTGIPEVVEHNAVISLSSGHELFGRAWNEE